MIAKEKSDYLEQRPINESGSVGVVEYPFVEGWILIERETDEYYGRVQWRNLHGDMTDRFETVEIGFDGNYVFVKSGLGALTIVK